MHCYSNFYCYRYVAADYPPATIRCRLFDEYGISTDCDILSLPVFHRLGSGLNSHPLEDEIKHVLLYDLPSPPIYASPS